MKQKLLNIIIKYRLSLIWLILGGLFGYSLLQLTAISNPKADAAYLRNQQKSQTTELKVKDSLRTQLERLVDTPVDTEPEGLGRPDPFNP